MSKVVVITGAGSGLGRAVALHRGRKGDEVVLLGRTLGKIEAVAQEIGSRALALACDVGSADSVRHAFAKIAERHPRIDALINNAAIYTPSLLREASDELILQMVSTNLTGAIFCSRAAIALLRPGGRIINISSESVDMPFAHLTVYQATKAALERLSISLNSELEDQGIHVGFVRAGQMVGEGAQGVDASPEVLARFVEANQRRGLDMRERPGTDFSSAAEIVGAVLDFPDDVHTAGLMLHGSGARR